MRASMVRISIPTRDTRTKTSITRPLSRISATTSARLLEPPPGGAFDIPPAPAAVPLRLHGHRSPPPTGPRGNRRGHRVLVRLVLVRLVLVSLVQVNLVLFSLVQVVGGVLLTLVGVLAVGLVGLLVVVDRVFVVRGK